MEDKTQLAPRKCVLVRTCAYFRPASKYIDFVFPENLRWLCICFHAQKVVTFKHKATCDEDFLLLTFGGDSMLA